MSFLPNGGEGGIRTPGNLAATRALQARALVHYATSPMYVIIPSLSAVRCYNSRMSLRRKALLALIVSACLWGTAGTVAKLLVSQAHPFVVTLYRFGAAALLIFPLFLAAKKPKGWMLDLLPLGLANAANVLFYFSGIALTTANTGSLLGAGVPLLTAILSWILIREPIGGRKLIGILLGLFGAMLIVLVPILEKGQAIGTSLPGNLLMVGSNVSWTLYIIRSRAASLKPNFNPILATFVNFLCCALASLAAALLTGHAPVLPVLSNPGYFAVYVYTVLGVTISTFFLFQWAVQHVSATTASLKEYLQLMVSVTVNFLVLGERFTPVFFLGSILILTGVFVVTGQRISDKLRALVPRID